MGSSHSTPNPVLVERVNVQCDSSGRARYTFQNTTGQPGRPGYYHFVCRNANMNQFVVKGIMVNGQITQSNFLWRM
jgi:hypothetical protein